MQKKLRQFHVSSSQWHVPPLPQGKWKAKSRNSLIDVYHLVKTNRDNCYLYPKHRTCIIYFLMLFQHSVDREFLAKLGLWPPWFKHPRWLMQLDSFLKKSKEDRLVWTIPIVNLSQKNTITFRSWQVIFQSLFFIHSFFLS